MSRDVILEKVAAALVDPNESESARRAAVTRRIKSHSRQPIPERARGEHTALVERFKTYAGGTATVVSLASPAEIPAAIADYLRTANLPARIRMGSDPGLASLPWSSAASLERLTGPAEPHDEVGLSAAVAGVAETGTLVLAAGQENPVTLGFLPETHIIVVGENQIVGAYEDAFDIVRKRLGDRTMPRTLNFISGPSRTADIAGTIVMGAHGPRRMCVLVVKGFGGPNSAK